MEVEQSGQDFLMQVLTFFFFFWFWSIYSWNYHKIIQSKSHAPIHRRTHSDSCCRRSDYVITAVSSWLIICKMISIPGHDRKEVCQKRIINLQRKHVQVSLTNLKIIAASSLKTGTYVWVIKCNMNIKYCLLALTDVSRKISWSSPASGWNTNKWNISSYILLLYIILDRLLSVFCTQIRFNCFVNVLSLLCRSLFPFRIFSGERFWFFRIRWVVRAEMEIVKSSHFCFSVGGPQGTVKTSFLSPDKFSKIMWGEGWNIFSDHLQAMDLMSIEPLLLMLYKSPKSCHTPIA